jgi:hypothetical protein
MDLDTVWFGHYATEGFLKTHTFLQSVIPAWQIFDVMSDKFNALPNNKIIIVICNIFRIASKKIFMLDQDAIYACNIQYTYAYNICT